jgi:3-hydroxyacyl-CoA dehydrogenase
MLIRSVAVLGAGTMGSQIAAHFANAGVPALLLDVSAESAQQGLQRARTLKPDPFFTPETWKLVTTGSFDAGLARTSDADWIIEAIIEDREAKRALLEKVDAVRRPGSIVSSNTSGIPIALLAEGRSQDFRQHWLGTHFFNPPRYLHLLEVIPTPDTLPSVIETVSHFADHRLGKGVVIAKDSPGFIGNHLAMFGMLNVLAKVASGEFTIEEADAITGPVLGRPRSATFRTLDIAGLDIAARVMDDLRERLPYADARETWVLPPFVRRMLERGMTGEKAGRGFYKRVKGAGGESEILTLDPATLEYRPRISPRLPSLDAAAPITDVRERTKTLMQGKDKVGQFLRDTLEPLLAYTAKVAPSIAHSPADVDRVLRWGFGWEVGPFELMDGAQPAAAPAPGLHILKAARDRSAIVKSNPGASLVDLGDGVLCVEFHSKMNAIGGDTIEMLQAGVREATRNFQALVVGNEGQNFSAGANLMLVLLEAQEENWDEIDLMIRAFQRATLSLRYSPVPVVVAPAGLTLGGGCEITLHADRVQAAAESYIGLVEVGVGLIPAGGGTKEMTIRAADAMAPGTTDFLPPIQRAFETIAFAKVSTSAADAERLGYVRAVDAISMNTERLIADAKARALQRVSEGYQPPPPRVDIPVGGDAVLAPLKLGIHLAWRAGHISDHDVLIGRRLAAIMAGGTLPHPSTVTEEHLLDLEREAFISLLGERKTQERIQHTLKTGKPLRN